MGWMVIASSEQVVTLIDFWDITYKVDSFALIVFFTMKIMKPFTFYEEKIKLFRSRSVPSYHSISGG
jgi:hypothetical protein